MAKGRIGVMTGGGDTTALNATLKGIALEVEKRDAKRSGFNGDGRACSAAEPPLNSPRPPSTKTEAERSSEAPERTCAKWTTEWSRRFSASPT